MTACAHSNRTSRRPSPRSPSIPERAAPRACLTEHVHSFHHCLGWGWRGCFPFIFFFLTSYFAFLFVSPSSLLPLPVLFCFLLFSFSPLPNSPQRSPGPCLRNLVLCPDQDLGDSPLPAPGPGFWAVGEILVFNQQNPWQGKAWSRGAYLNF